MMSRFRFPLPLILARGARALLLGSFLLTVLPLPESFSTPYSPVELNNYLKQESGERLSRSNQVSPWSGNSRAAGFMHTKSA